MIRSLLRWLALAILLTPLAASCEVLIYKGTSKESYIGDSSGVKIGSRLFLVVDRAAGKVARVQYTVLNGEKRYNTGTVTNLHEIVVEGAKGKSYSVLSRPPKQCAEDPAPESVSEGIYLSGVSALLTIDPETTTVFAKVVVSDGSGLFYSSQSNQPIIGQGSFVATFNQKETLASHTAGEDLDAAVARLVDQLELLGYTN